MEIDKNIYDILNNEFNENLSNNYILISIIDFHKYENHKKNITDIFEKVFLKNDLHYNLYIKNINKDNKDNIYSSIPLTREATYKSCSIHDLIYVISNKNSYQLINTYGGGAYTSWYIYHTTNNKLIYIYRSVIHNDYLLSCNTICDIKDIQILNNYIINPEILNHLSIYS